MIDLKHHFDNLLLYRVHPETMVVQVPLVPKDNVVHPDKSVIPVSREPT